MSVLERNGITKLRWAPTEQRESCDYQPENPCTDDPYPESLSERIMSTLKIWGNAIQRHMGKKENEYDADERVPRRYGLTKE